MDRRIKALVSVEGLEPLEVRRALPEDPSFQLAAVTQGGDETVQALEDLDCDILLMACTGEGDRAVKVIARAKREHPDVPILVLSTTSPNGFLRRAFDAGAADVVLFPQPHADLQFAMSKLLARGPAPAAGSSSRETRLICVLGPKGGTGKTLTTCNLAVELASAGERVLVVDLDLQFGDVALCMGLPPERTIYDLAVSGGSLDAEKLADYTSIHRSGVHALLAPSRPDQASAVSIELVRSIYQVASKEYDTIVVDTPPGFTAEVIATIDASTDLVMVGMLDSLSLKNTKLGLETLNLMVYDPRRIKLVLNRAHSRVGISQSDVVAVLGREPDALVPSDREIPRAINEGVPISIAKPQSEPAIAFRDLAAQFTGVSVQAASASGSSSGAGSRRRLFGRK